MPKLKSLLALIFALTAAGSRAQAAARYPGGIDPTYTGTHQAEFVAEKDHIRVMLNQAKLDVSVRLGLMNYREGFVYPLIIRFSDESPAKSENVLAYVMLSKQSDQFYQDLVINLEALSRNRMEFDTVFYHELTHAVMNDAVGGDATLRIPPWLQEGMAMYVSGEGDNRVKTVAESTYKSRASSLVFDLDVPVTGAAYPQYYLAVKYILDKHSINAVQGIIHQLVEGRSLDVALEDLLGMSVDRYKSEVRTYSTRIFKDLAKPDSAGGVHTLNHF